MTADDLRKRIEVAYAIAERDSEKSFHAYLRHVVLDSRPVPRLFQDVGRPWQFELLDRIGNALEYVVGLRDDYRGPSSFWLTLPRGHDKTSGIARCCNWLTGFSPRQLLMATAAGDSDQAGLIHEAMESEARLNPWFCDRLNFGRTRVLGPGGKLKILSADAGSSFGLRCDVVVVDELTHWKKRDLWDVLWSGREKMERSVFIVITNAGITGSWQHEIFREAKRSPDSWFVYESPGQLNTWMRPDAIQRMRRLLPPGLARRVIDNVWIDPAEESGYLCRADIQACEELGRQIGLGCRVGGERGKRYVASVDYGPKRDRTALAILHVECDKSVIVDRLDIWQGRPDDPIKIARVEEWLEDTIKNFQPLEIVCDPYQMEGTIQKYEKRLVVERFEARGGKHNYEMAENLRSLIVNRRLVWYPHAGDIIVGDGETETLVDELCGLVLKAMPYGYRFDHTVGFHDDRAVAIGMGALLACRDPATDHVVPATPQVIPVEHLKVDLPRKWGVGVTGDDWNRKNQLR